MSVGDLVICKCAADVWYRGVPGVIVDIDWLKDIHVLYGSGEIIRLAKSALEVVG